MVKFYFKNPTIWASAHCAILMLATSAFLNHWGHPDDFYFGITGASILGIHLIVFARQHFRKKKAWAALVANPTSENFDAVKPGPLRHRDHEDWNPVYDGVGIFSSFASGHAMVGRQSIFKVLMFAAMGFGGGWCCPCDWPPTIAIKFDGKLCTIGDS